MRKVTKKNWIKKLDKLFSEYTRLVERCDKCGSKENLQCAHVISRRHYHTRWEPENGLCLCLKCHFYWVHKEPHEFVRWFDSKFGSDLYDRLKKKSNVIGKIDYELKYKELKTLYDRTI